MSLQLIVPPEAGSTGAAAAPAPQEAANTARPAAPQPEPPIKSILDFIQRYVATLLAAGSQTDRVDRTADRIARSWGCQLELAILSHHFMLSVVKPSPDGQTSERRTAVASIVSSGPNFQRVAALNALSWNVVDQGLTLQEAVQRFEAVCAVPPIRPELLQVLVPCASAALCRLFSGTPLDMTLVFLAAWVGFFLRRRLVAWRVDLKITFVLCAFVASMLPAMGMIWHWPGATQIALATSPLFLVPGLPLINAVLDLLGGHVLLGVSRLIRAATLVICIALGLSFTMLLMGVESL
ncbi:threonine/serine ThrE exporter family protein [Desulfobulbus oralis]|uniref:Threonine/serine exporter-like N-terminal domain-containing protein n=1 Tax=Desulfobulbus oralis TaxID=1986146 RepID=A0A2L1GP65_9BACT|nr:threonine/serine exporter family protein [Desulfobulbus oralis]AVD71417.1 hypothetical protein CAY53_08010 [Desulfobulbus oralis]